MKIFIMTDMEGVCGVLDHDGWVTPQGRYYDEGRMLLTREVNAAVEGFFAAGAAEVHVADGHGYGGIKHSLLDRRTHYIRGFTNARYGLDETFTAIAFVGQHAKAGTEYAHIAHTGWFDKLDYQLNGISVGEFGLFTMTAAFLGVPCIFASGDLALCREAASLVPGLVTIAVKEGKNPGSGAAYDCDGYRGKNLAAVHLHPAVARDLIQEGAARALAKLRDDRSAFPLVCPDPPYEARISYRANKDSPAHTVVKQHPDDLVKLLSWD